MAAGTTVSTPRRRGKRALSVRLHPWFKKVHVYIGLVNLSIVLIWGVTGTYAMFASSEEDAGPATPVRTIPYSPKPGATDRDVANEVFDLVKPPLAGSKPAMSLERDAQKNLLVKFYRPGAVMDATVLEDQRQIRVEQHLSSAVRYMSDLHQVTMQPQLQSRSLRLWSYYTELSIWSLLAMALSGVLMWLLSRPRHRMAQLCFCGGLAVFLFLYVMVK